jgi:hypothetical protein
VCVCNICVFVLQPRVAKILGGANLLPAHLNFRNSAPKEGSLKKAEKKAERAAKAPAWSVKKLSRRSRTITHTHIHTYTHDCNDKARKDDVDPLAKHSPNTPKHSPNTPQSSPQQEA